jgi:H+-translocating NAD(P) transhydrogenase subunit alpha
MHGISGQQFAIDCFVFALAVFVGFELITKVPAILHTPLMSATNAIHGIVLVGAITVAAVGHDRISNTIAVLAVFLGTLNVVGGFVVTDRMLEMFKAKPGERAKPATAEAEATTSKAEDGSAGAGNGAAS